MPVTLNPARATFVQREFRYETVEDLAIKAVYPNAQEIKVDTQLSVASAATLATAIFNESKKSALVFEVEYEGIFELSDLDGSKLHYTLDAPFYQTDGRTFKLVSVDVDYLNNISKLVIRG